MSELLKIGRHEITAISRQGSQSKFPEGVKVAQVDYSNEETIAEALRGHDFLIISLNTSAGHEVHANICNAAGKAGIQWIIPNAYGPGKFLIPMHTKTVEEYVSVNPVQILRMNG